MTDEQISEIYALGRDAFFGGQKSFQVQAYPFRMTPQNLAKHRNNPHIAFWKMLKKGNDHFEMSRQEPRVSVCEKRYVFDAESPSGRALSFSPAGKCPVYQVSEEIASLVRDKEHQDDLKFAELSRRNVATAPIKTNADGGMHPVFVEAVKKNQIGVAPQEPSFLVTTAPGTIPVTVRPPRIPELVGAPTMTGEVPSPQLAVAEAAASDKPAAAPAYATTSAAAKPSSGNSSSSLFGSLFSSKSTDTKPAESSGGAIDRVARLVGLRGNDKDTKAEAPPAPKPKPAAKPTSVASNGAIRSRQPEAAPVKTTEAQAPAPAASSPPAAAATAPARTASPANTAMNGAAPVVQTGNFDSRWSGFR
jgi:hypothetical protein